MRRRDARTLLTIIQRHVQPGSLVYTDEWAAYRQMQRVLGFNHQTVNHSVNFVDPITGATHNAQRAFLPYGFGSYRFASVSIVLPL